MTLLEIIQGFCRRTNVPTPATVLGSTDEQILQILGLLEEEGKDLSKRGPWNALTFEATHTTLAAIDQGAITTIAPNGFNYIKNDTIWDRTNQWPVLGPINGPIWQSSLAWTVTGPRQEFRIRGRRLLVYPAPSAGWTWAFEYQSKNWIIDTTGVTYRKEFVLDTDEVLLDDDVLQMGLRWRWKKEKGLDYAEDFRTYEMQVKDLLSRDGGKAILKMDRRTRRGFAPGIFIPSGNWQLP